MQELTLSRLRDLVSYFSGVAPTADALSVTPPTVYAWLKRDKSIREKNRAAIDELWHKAQEQRAGKSILEKEALKRGLFTLKVFEGLPREAVVVCEFCPNPPHGSLVVCHGVLGRWSVAVNADLSLVTSLADGSILHLEGPPDHVVLGRLVSIKGEAVAA